MLIGRKDKEKTLMAILDFVYRRKNDLVEQQKQHLVPNFQENHYKYIIDHVGTVKVPVVPAHTGSETLLWRVHGPPGWCHCSGRLGHQDNDNGGTKSCQIVVFHALLGSWLKIQIIHIDDLQAPLAQLVRAWC